MGIPHREGTTDQVIWSPPHNELRGKKTSVTDVKPLNKLPCLLHTIQ